MDLRLPDYVDGAKDRKLHTFEIYCLKKKIGEVKADNIKLGERRIKDIAFDYMLHEHPNAKRFSWIFDRHIDEIRFPHIRVYEKRKDCTIYYFDIETPYIGEQFLVVKYNKKINR